MDENQKFHVWKSIDQSRYTSENRLNRFDQFTNTSQNRLNWFDQFRYTSQTG